MSSLARAPKTPPAAADHRAATLLVVEPELMVRRSFVKVLEMQGYRTVAAAYGQEALGFVQEHRIAVALLDVNLPDFDAVDLVGELRRASPTTAIVPITQDGNADLLFQVLNQGACDSFEKPIQDWERFYQVVRRNLALHEKDEELRELRSRLDRLDQQGTTDDFPSLVGNSPVMEDLKRRIRQVGQTNPNVLIIGDSGTGKELVARALHDHSRYKDGPFVAVNCAAIPHNLIESELFGHERGSFTGADRRHIGLCEQAAHGTLFLDEIGDLYIDVQAKLLRVLNERRFRRVGSTGELQLKARIISATHRDLHKAAQEGRFREDLLYRLNVIELRVPRLEDRRQDIQLLAYCFLRRANEAHGRQIRRIAPEAMAHLHRLPYRNNVRELQHIIERAVVLSFDDHELSLDIVAEASQHGYEAPAPAATVAHVVEDDLMALSYQDAKARLLDRFTVRYLEHRLREANNNISLAAELSGMLRPNFAKLMKKVGVVIDRRQNLKG